MPDLADAHAALLGNGSLQFDLPAAKAAPEPQPDNWHFTLGLGHVDLVWIVAGLAVVAIVWAVLVYLKDRPVRPAADPAPPPETALTPARVRTALADGDRLAADGRFLEAARALLASGIGFIADHHPASLHPTATSRDIARDAALPTPLRTAFGRIAVCVEVGLFGGRPVGADDYAECRRVFVASALAQAA